MGAALHPGPLHSALLSLQASDEQEALARRLQQVDSTPVSQLGSLR